MTTPKYLAARDLLDGDTVIQSGTVMPESFLSWPSARALVNMGSVVLADEADLASWQRSPHVPMFGVDPHTVGGPQTALEGPQGDPEAVSVPSTVEAPAASSEPSGSVSADMTAEQVLALAASADQPSLLALLQAENDRAKPRKSVLAGLQALIDKDD